MYMLDLGNANSNNIDHKHKIVLVYIANKKKIINLGNNDKSNTNTYFTLCFKLYWANFLLVPALLLLSVSLLSF